MLTGGGHGLARKNPRPRPASAYAPEQSGRPVNAFRHRPTDVVAQDERVHLRAKVARLRMHLREEVARLEAAAAQRAPAPQQAPTPQQQTPNTAALELQRLRQRVASDVSERAELNVQVRGLELKHDAAQVQLKRCATQLASLRSKVHASDMALDAERNSAKLQGLLGQSNIQDENATLKHDNEVLQRRLEAMHAELMEARAYGHAAHESVAEPAAAVNVELGFNEGGRYVLKLSD